jgi:hypothetical protein
MKQHNSPGIDGFDHSNPLISRSMSKPVAAMASTASQYLADNYGDMSASQCPPLACAVLPENPTR